MYKVELRIFHKGCWGSDINLAFPKHKFSSVDCRWINNKVAHIVHARGDQSKFAAIQGYLKKRKDVLKIEALSCDIENLYLRVLTKKQEKTGQFSDMFFAHHCFPLIPTRFEGRSEVWTLGSAKKENITKVYSELKKKYDVKLASIKEENIGVELTEKQRQAVTYANHFGYYEWPRKKTITEISEIVKIPKTVFLSHLRKAEKTIISNYLNQAK